jgi:hypothetical protein
MIAASMVYTSCSADKMMCPDIFEQGMVHVEVIDASTSAYLAEIARGEIRRGRYVEEMYRFQAPPPWEAGNPPSQPYPYRYLIGKGNGPGRYDVHVEAPGYQPWSRAAVRVEGSNKGCTSIKPVYLTARLVKDQ